MKANDYTETPAPPRRFDNAIAGLIVHWMQPLRLKAFRGFAATAALFAFTAGCETDGETVPVRTAGIPATASQPRPVMLASAAEIETAKTDNPVTAAATTTTTETATTNLTSTNIVAGTNVTASATSTNDSPILEEIPAARPANLKISDSTEKVIKLVESDLDEQVVLTFVQQTPAKFELDADEIVYLSDVGVPSTVIAAMLKHDGEDPTKAETLTAAPSTENIQPAIPANTNLPPVIAQTQPAAAPQQIEVTTNYIPNQQVVVQQPAPQTVVVQQPTVVYAQPETVTYFYDSLSPYGSWFYVSDFGWCWQPTVAVVDHGWRPYGPRGNWVWTDSGWYWHSDYTWGWAPFHYGRWHHHGGRGWIWVPDRVWGPAWVTWRSYDDYCGWAPLPPHAVFSPGFGFTYYGRGVDISFGFGLGYDAFCFAPIGRFHHRRVYDYCLPRHEVHRVYGRSHVANRWEYRNGRHEFVNRHQIGATERGLQPAAVRTMSGRDQSRYGNRERIDRDNRQTVIYTPPRPPATSGAVAGNTGGAGRGNFNPSNRADVTSRPSTASGIAAPAGQPSIVDPARRGGNVTTRPSSLTGASTPRAAGPGQTVDPTVRADRTAESMTRTPSASRPREVTGAPGPTTSMPAPSTTTPEPTRGAPRPVTSATPPTAGLGRPITSLPAPSTTTPSPSTTLPSPSTTLPSPTTGAPRPVTSLPAPVTTTPAPVTTTPAPSTSTPGIGTPPPTRAGEPRVINPATRRPFTEASPSTTVPGSPNFSAPPRSVTGGESVPSRRDAYARPVTPTTPAPQITTPAPSPRTITPSVAPSTSPRDFSPAPQQVTPAPRVISPPVSSPAPTRISPSAPTYSTPAYTPPMRGNISGSSAPASRAPAVSSPPPSRAPVIQSPSSRSEPPRAAGPGREISPNRGRGRE